MPRPKTVVTTAGATAAGAIVGGVCVRAADEQDYIPVDLGGVVPMLCIAAVCAQTLRRWLAQHENRARGELTETARLQDVREADLTGRESRLTEREVVLNRTLAASRARHRLLTEQVAEAGRDRAAMAAELEALRVNFQDLAESHDILVRREVTEGGARFAQLPPPTGQPLPMQHPAGGEDAPRERSGPCSVAAFRPREPHHESV